MGLHAVVLAGGSGTRLWPLSRERHPKQFLRVGGERTLFQQALSRLGGLDGVGAPLVVCNEAHRFLAAEQLREVGEAPSVVILEPVGRNTAPALTLAALALLDRAPSGGPGAVLVVLPADQLIRDREALRRSLARGIPFAARGDLVTFGVQPTVPSTAFGYIQRGIPCPAADMGGDATAYEIAAFAEKPDEARAREFVATGSYLWNSGIFMLSPSAWLEELGRLRPDIVRACREAFAGGSRDGDFFRPDEARFAGCGAESIDRAVMEAAPAGRRRIVVSLDAGWSDLGSWSALQDDGVGDADGNVIEGDVYCRATKNSLLIARGRLLAAVGLSDVIAVETADAVLVAHRDQDQEVRELVAQLQAEGRREQVSHLRDNRLWGVVEILDDAEGVQVRRLTVDPGAGLALQVHHHRAEHWVVARGTARVTRGDEVFALRENESTAVAPGVPHRLENPGPGPLVLIEVRSGAYLGEDDIVRLNGGDVGHPPAGSMSRSEAPAGRTGKPRPAAEGVDGWVSSTA